MSVSELTHVTTQPEFCRGKDPIVKFLIGPTNLKGRHPAVCRSTMTPVILFKSTFNELNKTLGRFFGKQLPVMLVGKRLRVTNDDDFIRHMANVAFLHREAGGYHILVKIYQDDLSGKEARVLLNSVADEMEKLAQVRGEFQRYRLTGR